MDRSSLSARLVPGLVIAAVVLFGLAVYADLGELVAAVRGFRALYLVPVLALAFGNYVIRFLRWHYYLRAVGVRVRPRRSASVFFSGLSMSVTPGKLGELVKCFMLRDADGVAIARSAPVVITERYTDLVAVLLLLALGVSRYSQGRSVFLVGLALVAALFVALRLSPGLVDRMASVLSRRLLKGRDTGGGVEAAEAFRTLLGGGPFVVGTVLGVAAWFLECLGFWLVFRGFGLDAPSLFQATFVYVLATLAGAISMLPGGLGATEVSMTAMLVAFGVTKDVATASTVIIRACTLWFAVLVGLGFYAGQRAAFTRALSEAEGEAADGPAEEGGR